MDTAFGKLTRTLTPNELLDAETSMTKYLVPRKTSPEGYQGFIDSIDRKQFAVDARKVLASLREKYVKNLGVRYSFELSRSMRHRMMFFPEGFHDRNLADMRDKGEFFDELDEHYLTQVIDVAESINGPFTREFPLTSIAHTKDLPTLGEWFDLFEKEIAKAENKH